MCQWNSSIQTKMCFMQYFQKYDTLKFRQLRGGERAK